MEITTTPPTANFVQFKYASLNPQPGTLITLQLPRELWRRRIWISSATSAGGLWFIGYWRLSVAGQTLIEIPMESSVAAFSRTPFHVDYTGANSFSGADRSAIVYHAPGNGSASAPLEVFTIADKLEVVFESLSAALGGNTAILYAGVLSDRKIF